MGNIPDRNPQYFEGVLQLRNPTEEVFQMIKSQMKKDGKVWVAKEVPLKTGVDLYLSSNKFLKMIGKKLKKTFPKGELKLSKSIFTRDHQTSKEVYRGTVCFRL